MPALTSNNGRSLCGFGGLRFAVWASEVGALGLKEEGLGFRAIMAVLTFNNHRSRCTPPGLRVSGLGVQCQGSGFRAERYHGCARRVEPPDPKTIGPMVVLGVGAVSYERSIPVLPYGGPRGGGGYL